MNPKIKSINIKTKVAGERGIPKNQVKIAEITYSGVGDDHNNYRSEKKDNTGDRAILIITEDLIETLNQEGWPIKEGDLGENLTITDIEFRTIGVDDRFIINDVELQITEACRPCNNLSVLPYVGDKIKIFISTLKNRRGWYAKVLREGSIHVNDEVLHKHI